MTKPTIGLAVLFVLTAAQADAINQKRGLWRNAETDPKADRAHPGTQVHQGNHCYEGEIYPAVVVKVWEAEQPSVNLHVLLDGSDSLWATSVYESSDHIPGTWHWPSIAANSANLDLGCAGEVGPEAPVNPEVGHTEKSDPNEGKEPNVESVPLPSEPPPTPESSDPVAEAPPEGTPVTSDSH